MVRRNKNGPGCRPSIVILPAVLLVIVMAVPLSAQVANEVCAGCHDEVTESFANTPHGVYFSNRPALISHACEKCHGSGVQHANEGDPELIINPANHDQFGGNELCLECHDGHQFDEWAFSSHNTAGITCSDCHRVHGDYSQSVKKTTPELCYDCHSDVRAASYMPSHHPIAEGKMGCRDCHGIHGESAHLTMNRSGRELCFSCHAEIEGPFVFEHAPVNEDCMICHTSHGSVADNLLKNTEPALCLNCHPMHFHSLQTGVDGAFVVPLATERNGVSTPDGWKRGMLTKCTQCHTEIHGSDLPSQAIPTSGNALTR